LEKLSDKPLLIVSATVLEIQPLLNIASSVEEKNNRLYSIKIGKNLIDLLITGVGIPSATYEIASFFALNKVPFAIHIGIAGSYRKEIINGSIVMIVEEEFGELGIWQGSKFENLFESGYSRPDRFPFTSGKLVNNTYKKTLLPDKLKKAKGLTISCVTSDQETIKGRKEKYSADIETMESAAFFYCCLKNGIPFLSLRGISNEAGVGDKSKWLITESVQNVCETLIQILQKNNFFIHET
jgi:futalosine hydrolase